MRVAPILIMLSVLLWGCATKRPDSSSGSVSSDSSQIPEWVYAPNEVCENETQFCASSEGASMEAADLNAKKSLASIFHSNIKSNFQIHTTAFDHNERGNLTEQVLSEVEESLEIVLQAVEIKQRYQKDKSFYSLAVLDKPKAAQTLALQIKTFDDQLNALYQEKKKINLHRMLVLFDQRQMLNERYQLVSDSSISSPYTFSNIMKLKYYQGVETVSVMFNQEFPQSLRKWFEGLISEAGFKLVDSNSGYSVLVSYKIKPAYLNVEGFKKFTFVTEVLARDQSLKQLGSFVVTIEGTGRNENDAFLRIKQQLQQQIQHNIDRLNLK